MRVRDSQIIKAVADLLRGKTSANNSVYEWRRTPSPSAVLPMINVVLDQRTPTIDDSLRVYKMDRRVTIILVVSGEDQDNNDTQDERVVYRLDDLEEEVRALIEDPADADFQTLGGLALRMFLSEVHTEREDPQKADRHFARRFLIYSVWTEDTIN